jgi:hypothetical protein
MCSTFAQQIKKIKKSRVSNGFSEWTELVDAHAKVICGRSNTRRRRIGPAAVSRKDQGRGASE